MLFKSQWANKLFIFLATFLASFGCSVLFLMILVNIKPHVLDPRNLWAMATAIFVNLGFFQILFKTNVSLVETWVRRVLSIGQMSFTTPTVMILFGVRKAEGSLLYFVLSALAIQFVTFVVYLITDRRTTRATLDAINRKLKENREE